MLRSSMTLIRRASVPVNAEVLNTLIGRRSLPDRALGIFRTISRKRLAHRLFGDVRADSSGLRRGEAGTVQKSLRPMSPGDDKSSGVLPDLVCGRLLQAMAQSLERSDVMCSSPEGVRKLVPDSPGPSARVRNSWQAPSFLLLSEALHTWFLH